MEEKPHWKTQFPSLLSCARMSDFGSGVALTRGSRMRSSARRSESARRGESRLVSFTLPGLSAHAPAMLQVSEIVDDAAVRQRHKQPAPERSSETVARHSVH